MLFIFRCKTGR